MKNSRRYWYPVVILLAVAFILYERNNKNQQREALNQAIRCLISHQGFGEYCSGIQVDPLLQASLKSLFKEKFTHREPVISISQQDQMFEIQIHHNSNRGLTLGVTIKSDDEYQVVEWSQLGVDQ